MEHKITVLDSKNRFHIFTGDDIQFYTDNQGCEIIDFSEDNNKTLAHFAHYEWVKRGIIEESKPKSSERVTREEPQPKQVEPEIDRFTEQDIASRDNAPLDHNDLAPEHRQQEESPVIEEEVVKENPEPEIMDTPPCETCGGYGTIQDTDSDDPLDTVMCPDC